MQFSNHRFVFRPFWTWFKYSKPKQWRSNFKLKNIEKNELVIGLAYNPDGGKPAYYTISSLATLRCENDTLIIGKPVVSFVAWNRENDSCRHNGATPIDILDGFFTENQAYYFHKLQEKYPTCSHLKLAFPIILENVNVVSDKHSSMKNKPTFWQHLKQWLQQLI